MLAHYKIPKVKNIIIFPHQNKIFLKEGSEIWAIKHLAK
jgi:hypothetical protein